jgi:hypothetical protein
MVSENSNEIVVYAACDKNWHFEKSVDRVLSPVPSHHCLNFELVDVESIGSSGNGRCFSLS